MKRKLHCEQANQRPQETSLHKERRSGEAHESSAQKLAVHRASLSPQWFARANLEEPHVIAD
jgi:hypothetical protein